MSDRLQTSALQPTTEDTSIRGVLLDIEGTTSSISFVHDVMFPFVLERLDSFCDENKDTEAFRDTCELIAKDAGYDSLASWSRNSQDHPAGSDPIELVKHEVRHLMSQDAKATGLKSLQGLIWKGGFESGHLMAHVYPDVIPAIKSWREKGIDVRIYSSGSVAAQKLFFGHLEGEGNCLSLLSGHYDTNMGHKKEVESYRNIIADWGMPSESVLFISDIPDELTAAKEAGLQVRLSLRPGNHAVPEGCDLPRLTSFAELTLEA